MFTCFNLLTDFFTSIGKNETASSESSAPESAVHNILSTMLSEGDPELVRVDRVGNHMLAPIAFRVQRSCVYCKERNGRFRGGQVRRSYYECSICQVPLCRPQVKNCFLKYHEDMVSKMQRK